MNKNLQSSTKLTEFAPLPPEEKPQSVGQLLSKFFKITKTPTEEQNNTNNGDNISQESLPTWAIDVVGSDCTSRDSASNSYTDDVNHGRSLPNVLKRISNLLALKTNNLQDYEDTELKQYWMPDSVSKECFECCEKFTAFRRRHHCRVCGQIFCSQCCYEHIPGKIFGCTGALRVCNYCCKVVLSYLQSSDLEANLTADLKLLQENLKTKYASEFVSPTTPSSDTTKQSLNPDSFESSTLKRKISVGYQEEKFASEGSAVSYLTTEEKFRALQNSVSLRSLFEEICRENGGLPLETRRYRLRTYTECFFGSELVDWLIYHQKAKTRVQASAICQALLQGGYIECISEPSSFLDGNSLYKLGVLMSSEPLQSRDCDVPAQEEPVWVQQIPHESSTTDSDNDQMSPVSQRKDRVKSSASYTLDLNLETNAVYLSRPPQSRNSLSLQSPDSESDICDREDNVSLVRPSEQRELVPESGWHNALSLRDENGEKLAYNQLTETFEQHEQSLLRQLLCSKGLSLSWADVILPLIHEVVDSIRPDKNHDAVDLDIRHYVQMKKLPGGRKQDTSLIGGIVCSKNVAHKGMEIDLKNPKILLLQCSVVYQRTEGRLMSIEPVLMQEHEHLRNVAARIEALQPNIVLVQKNVSRIALDLLRQYNITLVHNVKLSILERVARCTKADLVTAVDAHIGPPTLGTCEKFYVKTFTTEKGLSKTLMFFEGLPVSHLGCTIILRGANKSELTRLKKVASLMLFTTYNWRLEKSFLMDEFAEPPNSKCEFLDESKDNSPDLPQIVDLTTKKEIKKDVPKKEEFKMAVETVRDFTDPLQSYATENGVPIHETTIEKFTVSELPFSNSFKKALDDTILCISPYLMFPVPYLETDLGRRCKLRQFFAKDIYFSEQFSNCSKNKWKQVEDDQREEIKVESQEKPLHPFQTAVITTPVDNVVVQNLLASFRASGGQFEKKDFVCNLPEEKNEKDVEFAGPEDALDPNKHQRLSVLFCSFSHDSPNVPAFCVNPWVVCMDFYGRNDIPLGCFLERYCFRSTYICPSTTCDTSMIKHIRRFVHNSGCVSIYLNNFENEFSDKEIVMWTWCTKCQSVSPVVPMSADTWSYSFGKYLELKFHGDIYTKRGQGACSHSLHQDHYQYFGYKNYVASFKYSSVTIWEIFLPLNTIEIKYNSEKFQREIIDEIRLMAQKGHEIFSLILDKLHCLPNDEVEGLGNLNQLLSKEQSQFKQKVEEVQLKLTSPTIEKKDFLDHQSNSSSYWKISDSLVRLKRQIVETVDIWNVRLSEAARKRDNKSKDKSVPPSELESPVQELDANLEPSEQSDNIESDLENTTNIPKKNKSFDQCEDLSSASTNSRGMDLHNDISTSGSISSLDTHFRFSTDELHEFNMDECLFSDSEIQTESSDSNVQNSIEGQAPSSPRHHRSQSDGTAIVQSKEVSEPKKDDKKTVKNILSQLLPSPAVLTLIPNPFNSQDHYTLPTGVSVSIIVYESEPSSIVAYALNSFDYKKSFEELTNKKPPEHAPSPIAKRKNADKNGETEGKPSGVLGFLRNKDNKLESSINSTQSEISQTPEPPVTTDKPEDIKKAQKNSHIEVQFQDSNCIFFCRIYLAEKFAALRNAIMPDGEESYIRSLSRSVQWNARGGKSGSNFAKTADDRFILKEMSRSEVHIFLESAANYFAYMQKCCTTQQPTLLGKIVGVYQTIFKNNSNVSLRTNILVMENLFYNRTVAQKFDLKGSVRNRLVVPDNQEGEIVLLDENLLKMTCDSPLYILPHSKAVLTAAIQNDTEFLSSQFVMDYSLLVGLDRENNELVLGIIDYIRTFTWEKKLETIVKKSGILGGQGKLPTIISPEEYQKRFIEAMHKYFLEVPDHWAGLGKGLE